MIRGILEQRPRWQATAVCAAVGGGFLLLYLLTLAPTVLSSDSASFQTRATLHGFRFDARGYPIYTLLTKAFSRLPVGDVPYRVNLVSAVTGAVALWLLCGLVLTLTRSIPAAVFAAVSLGVAHMFWVHAVRAEIWTMQAALSFALIWLLVIWDSSRRWPLFGFALLLPIALFHHRFTLVSLPAFAWMLYVKRRRLGPQGRTGWAAGAAGFAALCALLTWGYLDEWQHQSLGQAVRGWLFMGSQFAPAFTLSPRILAYDAATLVGVFGYSLFGPALVLGLAGMAKPSAAVGRQNFAFLVLLLLPNIALAALYNVGPEKPLTYYVPALAVWAVFCGIGIASAGKRLRSATLWAVVSLQALPPTLLYAIAAPRIAVHLQRFMPRRSVEEIAYWATPWAQSARQFRHRGEAMLLTLPPHAHLCVGWATYTTLQYLQRVEGMRPDVRLKSVATVRDIPPELRAGPRAARVFVERAVLRGSAAGGYDVVCVGDLCEIQWSMGKCHGCKPKVSVTPSKISHAQ